MAFGIVTLPYTLFQYNVVQRVRELDLLQKTIDSGILTKLEDNGLDLATVEGLLPVADKLGLLTLAGNNQQLLVNGVAPLLVEGAPLIIPVLATALEIGPIAFFGGAAALAGLDFFLVANGVEIPFVGLSAGFYLGLLLVPLSAVLAALGVGLSSLKKAQEAVQFEPDCLRSWNSLISIEFFDYY